MSHPCEDFPHDAMACHADPISEKRIWLRAEALILLVAVASLSTLAKNSLYYPHHRETRFVNIASKMNAAKSPMVFERAPLQPVSRLVPPPPEYSEPARAELQVTAIRPIGLVVSPLRRPPPQVLA